MKKLTIYRCLPFKVWHQTFELIGGTWYPGGYRYECSCPYGEHKDVRYLDYRDPIHLNEILSLKKGTKLLTFCDCHEREHVAYHTFREFEFLSDFMRLMFKEKVATFEINEEQFSAVRWIAVINEPNEVPSFGRDADIRTFIRELSRITNTPIDDVIHQMKELENMPINKELKISTRETTENLKKAGVFVMY